MKAKTLFTSLLGIALISLLSFKIVNYEAKKYTCEVEQIQGFYIFTDSKPVLEYDYLGTVKSAIGLSSQYKGVRDRLIAKAKNEFPNADALIMQFKSGGTDKCDAIKFKENIINSKSSSISAQQNYGTISDAIEGKGNVNIGFQLSELRSDDVTISITKAESNEDAFVIKFNIANKTKNYLILKPAECTLKIRGNTYRFLEKNIIISPSSTEESISLRLDGKKVFLAKSFQLIFDGLCSITPNNNNEIQISDFKLPSPLGASFNFGNFKGILNKLVKEKDQTKAEFSCIYSGDKTGIIDFNKAKLLMPDDKEYPCASSKDSPILLSNGDDKKFILDWTDIPSSAGNMKQTLLFIKFNNVFSESTPQKLKLEPLNISGNVK